MQVFNACWEADIQISSTNTRTSCDRGYFAKIVADAKPYDDPEAHHLSSFIYSKLSSFLLERPNFQEFKHFVACMHGKLQSLSNISDFVESFPRLAVQVKAEAELQVCDKLLIVVCHISFGCCLLTRRHSHLRCRQHCEYVISFL